MRTEHREKARKGKVLCCHIIVLGKLGVRKNLLGLLMIMRICISCFSQGQNSNFLRKRKQRYNNSVRATASPGR
jgi:hypothetical protein